MSNDTNKVEEYYDEWTGKYLNTYGEILQAYRTKNPKKLLQYLMLSMGVKNNFNVLDAGCGVGAPAIFFAKNKQIKVDALTISEIQYQIATNNIERLNLANYIKVCKGDFHYLSNYYSENYFDIVYYLESLGHAVDVSQVIAETYKVLKPDSYLYIKDFFVKRSNEVEYQNYIDNVVNNVNKNYAYNVLDLEFFILQARKCGFEIVFIKPLDFQTEISVRKLFESKYNVDNYKGLKELPYAEWLELKFKKTKSINF